jgi:tRNA-specific 2-thiouridylase
MKSQDNRKTKTVGSERKPRVFVGVSGGVDSSVSLALLQSQGYDVTGVFLKVWQPEDDGLALSGGEGCNWREERRDAMRVCATLGVPFITINCEEEYKKEVVDYMIGEYKAGRVPNPDIFCNKYIKFGVFLKKALASPPAGGGADYVATGHYAQNLLNSVELSSEEGLRSRVGETEQNRTNDLCVPSEGLSEKRIYNLLESVDKNKDQSYFLYTLTQDQLKHILFPVGHLTKPEVRNLAEKFGLPTASKKDSQGLCFIGKVDMKEFLKHYIKTEKGDVLDTDGNVVGFHDGALLYAIGERHGFTITKKTPNDPRYFVVSKDMEKNTITIGDKSDESIKQNFDAKVIIIKDLHFISPDLENKIKKEKKAFECEIRIRYRQEKQKCSVEKISGQGENNAGKKEYWKIAFENPQSGVSIGQSAVLYDGEVCLGGGIIEAVI